MLVKLLKNDYYNRGKSLIAFCFIIFVNALMMYGVYDINDKLQPTGGFALAVSLIFVLCTIVLYAGLPLILSLAVSDFGKRYFKDQGYFTHTLPVKTSVLLMARMVADILNTIVITITYLFVMEILSRDYDYVGNMLRSMRHIYGSREATSGEEMTAFILRIWLFLFGVLFFLWQYNASYALGHTGNNGKKMRSIGFFAAFSIGEIIIVSLVMDVIMNFLYDSDMDEIKIEIFTLAIFVIWFIIGITVMGLITHHVCKKNLNLE